MSGTYDVIVIGSGLGGLTAAAALARAGKNVRLFERHVQAGGYATTFFRDRFEFEASLHELSGIGTTDDPGPLYRTLDGLGITRKVSFIPIPTLYRTLAPGLDIHVPAGHEEALDALVRAFPGERGGLESVMDQIRRIGDELTAMTEAGARPSPAGILARYPNLAHAAGVPVSRLIYREIADPRARLAVAQLWSYFGLPPSRLSLLMFAAAMHIYWRHGACAIREKSQVLSNAFVDAIRDAGGEVSLAHGVEKIIVENGHVAGVITEQGQRCDSRIVIANSNPLTTCTRLIEPGALPGAFLSRLASARPSLGTFCVYLGLGRTSRSLGIDDHEVYVNETLDMEEQYRSCLEIGPPGSFALTAYDVANPDFCAPGTGVVVLVTLSDGRAWSEIEPSRYAHLKQEMARAMLDRAEARYPGLRASVETAVVSTPVTNMRYTGNPSGAIYGFDSTPAQNPGFRLEHKGPLEGLWFAGAWTQPGGGYQPCISSGQRVAEAILAHPAAERRKGSITARGRGTGRARGYGLLVRDLGTVARTLSSKYRATGAASLETDATRDVVRRYHAERMPVIVRDRVEETGSAITLRLGPREGTVPPFFPGQYFNVFVTWEGVQTSRPYSISSAWNPGFLDVTVKRKPGGFVSNHLVDRVRTGDELEVTGPAGEFYLNSLRDTHDIVGIAVGSGITPFMSMVEDIHSSDRQVRLLLLYGSRTEEETIFRSRLESLASGSDRFRLVITLSRPAAGWKGERGRLDADLLRRCLDADGLSGKTFFVCGPRELYRSFSVVLGELGVPRSRIRLESYGPPEDVTREREWPGHVKRETRFSVSIAGTDQTIQAPAGEPLLNSLERAGITMPATCRSDVCDSCRVKLVDGEVFRPVDVLDQRTGHADHIHPCMSYPLSDISLVR